MSWSTASGEHRLTQLYYAHMFKVIPKGEPQSLGQRDVVPKWAPHGPDNFTAAPTSRYYPTSGWLKLNSLTLMIPQALIVPSWYKPLLLSKQALSLRPSGSCLAWDDKVKKARWDNSLHWLAFHLISFPGAIPAQHSLASTSWCKSIWDGRQEDKGPTQLLQRKPSTNMFFCFNHSFPEASLAERPLSSPSWCKSTATSLRRPSRRSRPNATASTQSVH